MLDYRTQAQVGEALYYLGEVPFSASFYSNGRARQLNDLAELAAKQPGASAMVAMSSGQQAALPEGTGVRLKEVSRRSSMLLMRWR